MSNWCSVNPVIMVGNERATLHVTVAINKEQFPITGENTLHIMRGKDVDVSVLRDGSDERFPLTILPTLDLDDELDSDSELLFIFNAAQSVTDAVARVQVENKQTKVVRYSESNDMGMSIQVYFPIDDDEPLYGKGTTPDTNWT